MKYSILERLARKGYLVYSHDVNKKESCSNVVIAALLRSFESLGFTLDAEGIKLLSTFTKDELKEFYKTSYETLDEISGASVKHTVFYKNFPNIKHIKDEEMYLRAVVHYLSVAIGEETFMNQDIKEEAREIVHNNKKTVLRLITREEAVKIATKMASDFFMGQVAIPYSEEKFLLEVIRDYNDLLTIEEIPFKENIALYFDLLLFKNTRKIGDVLNKEMLGFVKTSTDLLRVYAALSKGDITLRKNFKFMSLDRKCRRLFLDILNEFAFNNINILDDLYRHDFLWKRAFELLHVGEYKKEYKYIYEACQILRNDEYKTFYSKLDSLLDNQTEYLKLLKSRPGEYARRIDFILRNNNFDQRVSLDIFKSIAKEVSSNVLLSLWEHFKNRDLYETRIIKINKSNSTIYKELLDKRDNLELVIIDEVILIIEDALKDIYSSYPRIEKVYLDESLKQYALVRNNRNSSSQNKTLTFGTRIKLEKEDLKYLRFFTHFKNMDKEDVSDEYSDGRVDVDLSIEFINEKMNEGFSLAWHHLDGGRKFDSFLSGDIVDAPNGATEFCDLNYVKARKYARYALVVNTVYTGQNFADIPECFSGVMFVNEKAEKGEIFNPEFVKYKFNLTQKGSNANVAFALDLETLELIWIDAPSSYNFSAIVASECDNLIPILKDALKHHMNMYDFMKLHIGHITFVDNKEDAEFIVSDEEDANLKPFDVEKIASEWL